MVRSMIAGVAGLKSHQSKLDVIGNNIANVNTWSFKSYSYNFQDAMYTNSINSTGGSQLAGAAGGHNASQVGYGSQLSSISTEFNTGAPAPSSNNMDCMIDGTGFFLVGNMVNGSFDNIESSGLSLSRVGIFRVDNNGYLVDNQGSYVYGYAPIEGTGTPEVPETPSSSTIKDLPVDLQISTVPGERSKITIAGITVETSVKSVNDFEDAVNDWITAVGKMDQYVTATDDDIADTTVTLYKYENGAYTEVTDPADRTGELFKLNPGLMGKGPVMDANGEIQTDPATGEIMLEDKFIDFSKVNISLNRIGRYLNSATITIEAKEAGDTFEDVIVPLREALTGTGKVKIPADQGGGTINTEESAYNQGNDLVPSVAAEYADTLSTIRIPLDPDTGQRYEIQSWRINEDGTIMGTDKDKRTIPIGQLALVAVENPNGLEKQNGYYYSVGPNCGRVEAIKPNGGPVGRILGGNLEMANVDLANEFSNMITTQRGFQANSKIITVTDEMLQELVNMKR